MEPVRRPNDLRGPPRAATCSKWRSTPVDNRTSDRLLHWFRRQRIRREIRDEIHEAFMTFTAAIICW